MTTLLRATPVILAVLLTMAATAQADTATVHVVRKGCDAVLIMKRLQLVVPDDRKPGRNVRQVKRLEVITP